ncbi:MAG TPA: PAS domain S-box protein [Opitutaceae bacterium]|nr:PAS domain S-box protein [Opitutaceae bacterium]
MNTVLHLEDSPADGELIGEVLHSTWPNCRIHRVAGREAFRTALHGGEFDLILSDFSLPDLDGLSALTIARELRPEIPFIFMSGTIGEERAIEALRHGAMDYVIKDRPARLVPAIRQALALRAEETARRRSEEELRRNEERQRLLLVHARDAIFSLDEQGVITSLNPAFETIVGWPCAAWVGRPFHGLVHPDDLAQALRIFGQALQGETVAPFELRVVAASGRVVDLEFTIAPRVSGLGVMGIARNVTERRQALARIREQAEIIDRAPVAVVISDLEHRITYGNAAAAALYGATRETLVGRMAEDLFGTETMQLFAIGRTRTLATGSWHGEVPVLTRDGRRVTVEFLMSLIYDAAGRPRARLSMGIDVTERRQLETQVQRNARLDSIGLLASGIAHDLNNVLAPILVGVDLVRRHGGNAESAQRVLNTMEASARHGADLVRQLLAFARGGEIQRIETSVGRLVSDVCGLLERALPEGVELSADPDPQLPKIMADGTQLKQVLLNLAFNARDAMPGGGRITLGAAMVEAAHIQRVDPPLEAIPHVRISIADTGTGIRPEVLPHIFEPFFTTKEVGKGTGIGLSTVRSIVQQHNGAIVVSSELGVGTTFAIYLPALSI